MSSDTVDPVQIGAWPVVHIAGIGDDGPSSLAPAVLDLVHQADLLCGGERHLAFFAGHPAERFTIKSNIAELLALLEHAPGRRRAVVLASGDPCFFGVGPIIAERLGREQVRVHPQPSSVSLAFARLGMAWQDAAVLSAHGRPIEGIIGRALAAERFAVLTDPANTPSAVAAALLDAGMEDARAFVLQHLGGPAERIVESTLCGVAGMTFAPLNVLVVDRDPADVCRPRGFGLHEDAYESERGQITKAEVRAVVLAKLAPLGVRVAWDVGAGAGSVAIELAALMPNGVVYAVECDAAQVAVLHRNLVRHRVPNVRVIHGAAPAALAALPPPDAVFVGGTGRDAHGVLSAAAAALAPGGRLVAGFAQLESLAAWQVVARDLGWPAELVQVSVARGAAIADGTRLAALNPVFVTTLYRPHAVETARGAREEVE